MSPRVRAVVVVIAGLVLAGAALGVGLAGSTDTRSILVPFALVLIVFVLGIGVIAPARTRR